MAGTWLSQVSRPGRLWRPFLRLALFLPRHLTGVRGVALFLLDVIVRTDTVSRGLGGMCSPGLFFMLLIYLMFVDPEAPFSWGRGGPEVARRALVVAVVLLLLL